MGGATLNGTPLVSCLCVTERRPAFTPWLRWCYARQTWPRKELVVIDSSPRPMSPAANDVRVIAVPDGTNVPAKRNVALGAAQGDYIAWFDDDYWQHPARLTETVPALLEGAAVAGARQSWFVDLLGDGTYPYRTREGVIFNAGLFAAEIARKVAFDEKISRASDAGWLTAVLRQSGAAVRPLPAAVHTLWLCHDGNLSNPRHRHPLCFQLALARNSVGQVAWAETDDQLSALRARLQLEHRPS